jgi:hypothetical protein
VVGAFALAAKSKGMFETSCSSRIAAAVSSAVQLA